MKKILVIDNQDSFVYNLVEMLRSSSVPYTVIRSDELQLPLSTETIAGILLSPGGGLPHDYPQMIEVINQYHHRLPMLGVCLGHQAIAQCFGAQLQQLPAPLHGHASQLIIHQTQDQLIHQVDTHSIIGRYHSWVVSCTNLPTTLKCIATDESDNMMILRHADYPIWGVQFHPESVITDQCGQQILRNWLTHCSF